MTFLPMVLSKGSFWSAKSRQWLQIQYDIVTLPIEFEGAQTFSDSQWLVCIREGPRKNDQDSRIGENTQNGIPNIICHCRLELLNKKLRKIELFELG